MKKEKKTRVKINGLNIALTLSLLTMEVGVRVD